MPVPPFHPGRKAMPWGADQMECTRWFELLIDRLAGELAEDEAALLEQHLARCAHCRREEKRIAALLAAPASDGWSPGAEWPRRILDQAHRMRTHEGPARDPRSVAASALFRARVAGLFRRAVPVYAVLAIAVFCAVGGIWAGR